MFSGELEILRPYIKDIKVLRFDSEGDNLILKAEIQFKNDTVLFFKEVIIEAEKRKYSYHFQTKEGMMICRWDNAPDWADISTYPHHKHINNQVLPNKAISAQQIFEELRDLYLKITE